MPNGGCGQRDGETSHNSTAIIEGRNTSFAEQQTTLKQTETEVGPWFLLIIPFQQKASFCNSNQDLITVSGCALQGAWVWSVSDAAHPLSAAITSSSGNTKLIHSHCGSCSTLRKVSVFIFLPGHKEMWQALIATHVWHLWAEMLWKHRTKQTLLFCRVYLTTINLYLGSLAMTVKRITEVCENDEGL